MTAHRTRLAACLAFLFLIAADAEAAPPVTQVDDMLYRADGSPFNGTATISWRSFVAADTTSIPANSVTVPIVQGSLRVRLVPTTNASSGAYYVVRFNTERNTQFTEFWGVPPSSQKVTARDVRLPAAPGTNGTPPVGVMNIVDINGLPEALNDRPVKGLGYTNNRLAMIDLNGEIVAVAGPPADCVRADGTTAPCISLLPPQVAYVDHEAPGGSIDGANRIFTLASAPAPSASLHLFRNGILQREGVDFLLSGQGITFLAVSTPQPGDILSASYRVTPGQ